MKKSELLTAAIPHLWVEKINPRGKWTYVCNAVKATTAPQKIKDALLKDISESIDGNSSVKMWLFKRGIEVPHGQLQKYRLMWVLDMIQAYWLRDE